ncbi:unnamed protein product [Urochloa decumbens]|uniref:F-box domain-containing protein n=1 Tax=Urochloa decumbens TaxID=240449 RepID=A0ABC8WAP4_9POAL
MCTHALPDDIPELILVRLDSTACLIRASSTCKRWRRVVAGVGFLRRFRSIHGPPIVAGTYDDGARFTPTPSSGIDGRHFSLDFLPGNTRSSSSFAWVFKDTRAGLVLLERNDRGAAGPYKQDLVICDPLSRRYEIIAPFYRATWFPHNKAFLLDGDSSKSSSMAMADGGCIGLSNFRVICVAFTVGPGGGGYEAFVFTSGSSCGWRTIHIHGQSNFRCFSLMGHSEGKIYWWVDGGMAVVVNRATADLASFVLRDGVEGFGDGSYEATVTTGRNGEARIAVRRIYRGNDYVKVFAARQQELAARGIEWALEKTIRLPAAATPGGQWHDGCWSFSKAQTLAAASCRRKGTVFIRLPAEGLLLALDLDSETIEPESALSKVGYPVELPWPPVLRACRQPGTDLGDHHER